MEKLFNECEVQNIDILISEDNVEIDVHWNCVDTTSKDNVDLRQLTVNRPGWLGEWAGFINYVRFQVIFVT